MTPASPSQIQFYRQAKYLRVEYRDGTGQVRQIEKFEAREFQVLQLGNHDSPLSPPPPQVIPPPGCYEHQPQRSPHLQIQQGGGYLPASPHPYHPSSHHPSSHHPSSHHPSPRYQPPHNRDYYNLNPAEGYDQSSTPYLSPSPVPAKRENRRIRPWVDGVDANEPLKNPYVPSRNLASPHSGNPGEGSSAGNEVGRFIHAPPQRPLEPSQIYDSIELVKSRAARKAWEERVERHYNGGQHY